MQFCSKELATEELGVKSEIVRLTFVEGVVKRLGVALSTRVMAVAVVVAVAVVREEGSRVQRPTLPIMSLERRFVYARVRTAAASSLIRGFSERANFM
jgi:hypothetical protein